MAFIPWSTMRRKATSAPRPLRLLAQTIAFTDPITGQEHTFSSRRSLGALPQ